MTTEDLIKEGIDIVNAGDLARASAIFARVVKTDPMSEQGWYWLAMSCTDPDRRKYCFQRVLSINPANLDAVEQLELLNNPEPPVEWPAFVEPPANQPYGSSEPVPPVAPGTVPDSGPEPAAASSVSPFIFDERDSMYEPAATPAAAPVTPSMEDHGEELKAWMIPETPEGSQPGKDIPQKKKPKSRLGLLVAVLTVFLICFIGVGYLYTTGEFNQWLPADLLPGGQNQVPVIILTPTPLGGMSPTPAASPTPTPTATPTAYPTAMPTIAYSPVLENVKCKFDIPEGAFVNCYTVSVPEDRTNPKSEMVKLAVAVYHSKSKNPAADPVIFLQGGPGGEVVTSFAYQSTYDFIVAPFLEKRDFIVFDPRGTGLSEPSLVCKELSTVYSQDIRGQIPASSRNMIYSNAFLSCHGAMRIGGVNLAAYTSDASAADVKDILAALNYKTADLYGASYGTRMAQSIMRLYPEIVRAVVVDSVVPAETKFFNDLPAGENGALDAMFAACAADEKCHQTYPDLENVFWQLVDRLDKNPVKVTAPLYTGGTLTEYVNGSTLISVVTLGMLKSSEVTVVPQSIYQVNQGDYTTLIQYQASLPYEFEGISPSVYVSVMCHEHLLATTPDQLKADTAPFHAEQDYARLPFFGTVDDMFKTCKNWGAVAPSPEETAPVVSDIPTLVISGKYDTVTPPAWGRLLASHLSRSFFYEFPNQGHCPTFADGTKCALGLVLDFLDDPSRAPNSMCLAKITPAPFTVAYTGDPPIKLKAVDDPYQGISFLAPADWVSYGDGFYRREESQFDITQLIILQSPFFTSQAILDSLSSKLYGYGGFDAAPIATGQRTANGMTWSLYTLSSYGRPVDLALAEDPDSGGTFVVLLFCHNDEHEAFYNTLYLPVIDSITYSIAVNTP